MAYLAAFGCAVCYGVGSVLQCVGARRLEAAGGLDPRLLARMAKQLPYLLGLTLDLVGWVLSLIAVRTLPLFAVQATLASSVGVTAVVAAIFLHNRPGRAQVTALGMLGAGVILLAVTAEPSTPHPIDATISIAIALGVFVLAGACVVTARALRGERAALVLGILSGLAFGGTALCGRAIETDHTLTQIIADPLSWALLGYGALGLTVFGTALQRGSVTIAMAGQAAAETVAPAIAGLVLLGDKARPGTAPLAIGGFVLAVAAASLLAARCSGDHEIGPEPGARPATADPVPDRPYASV